MAVNKRRDTWHGGKEEEEEEENSLFGEFSLRISKTRGSKATTILVCRNVNSARLHIFIMGSGFVHQDPLDQKHK